MPTSPRFSSNLLPTLFYGVLAALFIAKGFGQSDPPPTQTADTVFSQKRGIYEAPFDLEITTATEGATIVYTTNGNAPTETSGIPYSGPISINGTTILRAFAYKEGLEPTNIDTVTYIFPTDVVNQPESPFGLPTTEYWLGGAQSNRAVMGYGMDPVVTQDPAYAMSIIDGLKAIPSMSIVGPNHDFFGNDGYYDGDDEKVVSIELLYADDPTKNERTVAGIESHSHLRMKRSLRLNFRAEYGDAKWKTDLFRNVPYQETVPTNNLDRIILRAGNNRAWSRIFSKEKTTFAIDELQRQNQLAISGDGKHGAFVHLYINGLYWGLYNPVERADRFFTADYYGGPEDDWFVVTHGGELSGNNERYNYLKGELKNKNMANPANYEEMKEYLDIDNFIDYLLVHWYSNTSDWPSNNWYGANRNASAESPTLPMKFFAWDGEWSWNLPRNGGTDFDAQVSSNFKSGSSKFSGPAIAQIFNSVKESPEFIRRLGDRAQRHFFNDGPMTDAKVLARYTAITDYISGAVISESARWGDTLEELGEPTFTRDTHWTPAVNEIKALIPGRAQQLIDSLRAEGYFPTTPVPVPIPESSGGVITPGFLLTFEFPIFGNIGDIFYTLNGEDPINGDGQLFTSPIPITDGVLVKARRFNNDEWSALVELTFLPPEIPTLRVSELHFNPADPTVAEVTAGFDNNDDFEFIELKNIGTDSLDVSGYQFTDGVDFVIPMGTILVAGKTLIIANNPAGFAERHGFSTDAVVLGGYGGKLSNGGETIQLATHLGQVIQTFTYLDDWYPAADGTGPSIEMVDATAALDQWNLMAGWMASAETDGTPETGVLSYASWTATWFPAGGMDAATTADPDGDGRINLMEYALLTDPLAAEGPSIFGLRTDEEGTVTYRYQQNSRMADLTFQLQWSEDLQGAWTDMTALLESSGLTKDRYVFTEPVGTAPRFYRLRMVLAE